MGGLTPQHGRIRNDEENCLPEAVSLRNKLSSTVSASFKFSLEVPLVKGLKKTDFLVNKILNDVFDCHWREGIETKENGCMPYFITNFEMNASSRVSNVESLKNLTQVSQSSNSPFYFYLKINDPSFYSDELINEMTFGVESVGFGTLLPTMEYISHWIINYDDENFVSKWKKEFTSRFKAVFNFDEIKLVTIQIWSYDCSFAKRKSQGKKTEFEYYWLVIERKQLQRLIISHTPDRTTIFFELSYPAIIRKNRIERFPRENETVDDPFHKFEAIYRGTRSDMNPEKGVQVENRFIQVDFPHLPTDQLYALISRIYQRTHINVEFARIDITKDIIHKQHYHNKFQDFTTHPFDLNSYFGNRLLQLFPKVATDKIENNYNEKCRYDIIFLMYVLTSLGAYVKDQIFRKGIEEYHKFCNKILLMIEWDYSKSVIVLEALIRHLNIYGKKHAELYDILTDFHATSMSGELSALPYDANLGIHYEKIGVIVITPTRLLFKCPELHMGNTVTRFIKDNTRMVRVIVREDDNSMLRIQAHGEKRFKSLISDKMAKGINICERVFKFFGASGSQQREMGMYFMDAHLISDVFKALGKFDREPNMYKRLTREGQNLTQSIRCTIKIKRKMWNMVPDFTSHCPETNKKFTFSDGCGLISKELWLEMCHDLKINNPPCAFQFRYLGFKGMLTVNPFIKGRQVCFRDSQCKFGGRKSGYMELVKCAQPQPTNLSKQFVNILCQNSSKNPMTHKRILNRLLNLYEDMFMTLANALTDEKVFRNVMKELPYFLDIDILSEEEGFVLHQEPFFKSLVLAYVKQKLEQQIKKLSIPMPPVLGRSLFGVVDEMGILEPGQVFVQWSASLKTKYAHNRGPKKILEGKVTVTKNPCLASGDVRIFEAVNRPELAELYWDVIVFPSGLNGGIRPHPDEMAGSDLDGDEYTVICDDELLLDHNEVPFDFEAPEKTIISNPEWDVLDEQNKKIQYMLDFFVRNKIGIYSDAQFNISDMHGINSQGCLRLIRKATMSLDFAKSGLPPEDLTIEWEKVNGEYLPPEKALRRADFKAKEECGPTYATTRMNGIIHRSNRQLASLITTEAKEEEIAMNPIFMAEYEKLESFRSLQEITNRVRNEMNIYNSRLKGILETYGIKTEGELFSGCILNMINKLNEREEDDGSNFTTTFVVEKLIILMFKEFRERFFDEFGGWLEHTQYKGKREELEGMNVLNRYVKIVTHPIKLKALICYKLAYERAIQSGDKLLSFGWLAWDVLAKIQRKFNSTNEDFEVQKEGIFEKIRDGVMDYARKHEKEYRSLFVLSNYMPWMHPIIETLHMNYKSSIFCVLLVLIEWAKKARLIRENFPKTDSSKFILLLVYAAKGNNERETLFEAFEPLDKSEKKHEGELLMALLKRLTLRRTIEVESVIEREIGGEVIELNWLDAHEAARKSYYSLCIHQNVEEILDTPIHTEYSEKETMIIELPTGINDRKVLEKLMNKTGASEMTLKRRNRKFPTFVTVLYRGNADVEEKLRRLVQLEAQKILKELGPTMDVEMAKEVYLNIMK